MKTLLTSCLLLFAFATQAQTFEIKGKITEKTSGEAMVFVNVQVYKDSTLVTGGVSDINGKYSIRLNTPDTYTVKAMYIGTIAFHSEVITLDSLSPVAVVDITIDEGAVSLQECFIVAPTRTSVKKSFGYSAPAAGVYKGRSRTFNKNHHNDFFRNEEYNSFHDNQFRSVKAAPLSTLSIDVDNASYTNIRRMINQGRMPDADAVRSEEMINYFSYNYPQPDPDVPLSITTEYADCPWNAENKLLHIGIQGKVPVKNDVRNNLVFLLDVSGSMDNPDKLPLVIRSFELMVNQLNPDDRVAIVVYAGSSGVVLPSTTVKHKNVILDALTNLSAGGSTAGGDGIQLAYNVAKSAFIKNGNNRVILATDGDFNVGPSSQEELISLIEGMRDEDIFLTVLGFGMGNYKDGTMEVLSNAGNGNYFYIDSFNEARKVFVNDLNANMLCIAKDVKIQIEFNPDQVKGYRLIGYENRVLKDEDFKNDKKDAGDLGAGHHVTALYEIIPTGSKVAIEQPDIDSLRYQVTQTNNHYPDELLTIKMRYKEPKGIKSKSITHRVTWESYSTAPSERFEFSAAVAAFGMLLRNSEFKGNANYDRVLEMARHSKGEDASGYRAEFINLVEMAKSLSVTSASKE